MLTTEQQADWKRDGFLVLPGFVSAEACAALRARYDAILDRWEPPADASVFSTTDQERRTDERFLRSASTIEVFLEEGAEGRVGDGPGQVPKHLAVNKLGHAMHDLDPGFDAFSRTPAIAELVYDLGLDDPLLLQSMYLCKQPHIGGEVVSHQDLTFLYTDPATVVGLWFALEDATVDNGCLWALPGGHRAGLRRRFWSDGERTWFEELTEEPEPDPDAFVPLEAAAGTLVVLNGLLPHRSGTNTSGRSRHAYSVHLIDGSSSYPPGNWLERGPELPLRGF